MRIKLLLTLVLLPLSWPSFLTASSHSVVLSSSESSIDQSESSEVWRSLTPENWRNAVYHKGSFFEDLTNEYQETLEETKNIYQKGRRIVVIELGCGTGDFLFNTGQKADYLIGVDFNIDFLEFAKKEKAKNRFKNVQFIHGDGNVLNDLLHEHAPSWIWEDDVLRIVACVGNTFGVIPQEMKANCMQQMLLAAGTEGFIFVGYWNGNAFPEAVANFYAKNQTLCGSFSEENVDYKEATLSSQSGYSTRWMFPTTVKNEIAENDFEILSFKDQGVGVTYLAKSRHNHAKIAREYYDSDDAYNFYKQVWGGENIHIGEYKTDDVCESTSEKVKIASKRSLEYLGKLADLEPGQVVVDLGSAYGGAVRYLSSTYDVKAIGIDISGKECQRARELNHLSGFNQDKVIIKECSFVNTGLASESVDVVVSQDSLLHAGAERDAVIAEVARVLKPGGRFVFLDPMQADHAEPQDLQAVYQRIQLKDMASPSLYQQLAENNGLELVRFEDRIGCMDDHYRAVAEVLDNKRPYLENISEEYLDNMSNGLQVWVDAIKVELLAYGAFVFKKN